MRNGQRTQCQLFCGHLAFEASWEGEKLNKWVLHELTENQNNNKWLFWSVIFPYSLILCLLIQHRPFLDWIVMCEKKVDLIWQQAFWSWWNHYIWEVCSANWWDALKTACLQPPLFNGKCLIHLHDNQSHFVQPTLQTLNKLGYEVLPHLPYSPDLLPADYHFFKSLEIFFQGKYFYNQQEAENIFQNLLNPEGWIFMLQEQTHISHWQNVLIIMVPILINKDVFEPSYSDLKFTVQNYNYICTNLIYDQPR